MVCLLIIFLQQSYKLLLPQLNAGDNESSFLGFDFSRNTYSTGHVVRLLCKYFLSV